MSAKPLPHIVTLPWSPPEAVAQRLAHRSGLAFFDSAMRGETHVAGPALGRYSYVMAEPFGRFEVTVDGPCWNGTPLTQAPLPALRALLSRHALATVPGLPPFQGGAAGYLAYEFGHWLDGLDSLPRLHGDKPLPDVSLLFYDVVIAFDHQSERCWLISSGLPETDTAAREQRARARARADAFLALLSAGPEAHRQNDATLAPITGWRSNFTGEHYAAAVGSVVEAILDGEIFQANLSQCFTASFPEHFDPWEFYRHLRMSNPAPFCAFLDHGDTIVASSSPERFVSVIDRQVETRPIKGTAPRAYDPAEDARRASALLASDKDRAENLMIVDLLRNDLSRVCKPGTVATPLLAGLESYAGVHHLVSAVTGELDDGKDALDLIEAAFPGGSITGAPKHQAMQVISRIEQVPRGVYCGCLALFGFNGMCDTSIAIRTVTFRPGQAGGRQNALETTLQAGGGITALSVPTSEYEETLHKAERLFRAFAAYEQHGALKHGALQTP